MESNSWGGRRLGCFELERVLGSGPTGTVHLAHHEIIRSQVAIKVLHQDIASDQSAVFRYFEKARGVNLIGCPTIAKIYDFGFNDARYYVAMERAPGESLSRGLGSSLEEAQPILEDVMDALAAAHEAGFAHRDLKPENVKVALVSGRPSAKLVDFEIAELHGHRPLPAQPFLAPEQIADPTCLDPRSDIFALGVMMFWIATGTYPIDRSGAVIRPSQANPEIHSAQEAMIVRAVARDPDARYQTIRDLHAGFELAIAIAKRDRGPPLRRKHSEAKSAAIETLHLTGIEQKKPGASGGRRSRADFVVRLEVRDHASFRRMYAMDIAHHGMFIDTMGALLPIQALVDVEIGGLSSDAKIVLLGRVVRQVTAADAQAFGGKQGMAIQLLDFDQAKRSEIERLIYGPGGAGERKERITEKNPKAERIIERFAALGTSPGPYHLLQILPGSPAKKIRETVNRLSRDADPDALGAMTDAELERVVEIRRQVELASAVLLDPKSRAAHDGASGNFQGVAQALASGLSVEDLATLRREFLATRWDAAGAARAHVKEAMRAQYEGRTNEARTELERALHMDPLDLEVHNLYWALRHKMEQTTSMRIEP